MRSHLMLTAMLLGVIADRPALSMRAVAIVALVILAVLPDEIVNPGFQMSFAAVIGLIALAEWAASRPRRDEPQRPHARCLEKIPPLYSRHAGREPRRNARDDAVRDLSFRPCFVGRPCRRISTQTSFLTDDALVIRPVDLLTKLAHLALRKISMYSTRPQIITPAVSFRNASVSAASIA